MEQVLLLLPTLFCYLTGIIIAWSLMILVDYYAVRQAAKHIGRALRKDDYIRISVVTIVTTLLLAGSFVPSAFVANIMDMLIILEMWYVIFLIQTSDYAIKSQVSLKQIQAPKTNIVHFAHHTDNSSLVRHL